MHYTTGMTLAGALAASIPAVTAPAPGLETIRLLSDSLPSAVLFVSVTAPCFEISTPIDRALRSAHRASTQLIELL
jgi:hypothetical protein